MAKRNKKATGRPGSTKLKIGRGNKPIHKELKIEEKIVENRVTTFTGNSISNEATVAPSELREYSSHNGSSSKDQDNPTSGNRTQERTLQSQIFPESGVTDSEVTINDAIRINPDDIKMKTVPQQTAENTFRVLPNISCTPETSKVRIM
uniref:Required for respiratory growth protein 9, mitochondrial n=2 Tax=Lygus hesperus TaxID=30085 RepID=A0A0A9WFZ1_LYGHE